MYSEMSQETVI